MKFIKTYIINKNSNLDFFFLKEKIQRKIVTIKEKNEDDKKIEESNNKWVEKEQHIIVEKNKEHFHG